jgi:branched-chain amino acid transport system permease protein
VSLFLQYAGALFLPNSPPPSINENVNPFQSAINIQIRPASSELLEQLQVAQQIYTTNNDQLAAMTASTAVDVNAEDLADQELVTIRSRREAEAAQREVDFGALTIRIPQGQLLMLGTAIVLMLLLRQLVQRTSAGRAMRAVAQDFDSASLMGINVNKIITLTFIIGSALAGAAAMMTATFIGTPLTTFVGVQPGVKAFVAAVLGGIGSIPGAVLGGLVMGIAETMVVWVGLSSYRDAIALVILIVVLLFKPGGLMGSNAVEKV